MTRNGFSRFLGAIDMLVREPIPDKYFGVYLRILEPIPDHAVPAVADRVLALYSIMPRPAQILKAAESIHVTLGVRQSGRDEGLDELAALSVEEQARTRARYNVWVREMGKGVDHLKAITPEQRERMVTAELSKLRGGPPAALLVGNLLERVPGQEG